MRSMSSLVPATAWRSTSRQWMEWSITRQLPSYMNAKSKFMVWTCEVSLDLEIHSIDSWWIRKSILPNFWNWKGRFQTEKRAWDSHRFWISLCRCLTRRAWTSLRRQRTFAKPWLRLSRSMKRPLGTLMWRTDMSGCSAKGGTMPRKAKSLVKGERKQNVHSVYILESYIIRRIFLVWGWVIVKVTSNLRVQFFSLRTWEPRLVARARSGLRKDLHFVLTTHSTEEARSAGAEFGQLPSEGCEALV